MFADTMRLEPGIQTSSYKLYLRRFGGCKLCRLCIWLLHKPSDKTGPPDQEDESFLMNVSNQSQLDQGMEATFLWHRLAGLHVACVKGKVQVQGVVR